MSPPFVAATVAGLAASIAQVLVLRELLVLFLGNELSTGLVFGCWLFWTALGSAVAGRLCRRSSNKAGILAALLALLAIVLPLSLAWIRGSRIIWSISRGELVGPGLMLGIALTSTFLFCTLSGAVFAFAWALKKLGGSRGSDGAVIIYLGEAAGAALGGLVFYFLLLPHVSALGAAFIVSLLLVASALWVSWTSGGNPKGRILRTAGMAGTGICLLAAVLFMGDLERITRRWQWGDEVVAVRDTPFHNLTLLKRAEQFSLFSNGQWLFSVPDQETAEFAVHLALLQHAEPKNVLLIGGGVAGLTYEILKHPMIRMVDYVEPDPEIIRLSERFLPSARAADAGDPRVHIFHADAVSFARTTRQSYDVIFLNVGDPVNADTNRFYTREFFERLKGLLSSGGILTFAVTSSPDILGSTQARFLQSLHLTAGRVFAHVLVYPGESARFMASDSPRILEVNPRILVDRIAERGLQLQYVREYSLFDRLNPMRVSYLQSIIKTAENPFLPVNEDLKPTCYFHGLAMWSAQAHPLIERFLSAAATFRGAWFWGALGVSMFAVVGVLRIGPPRPGTAVALCVMVVGGVQMVLEVLLLVVFQILEGFVYKELALIITSFMSGIAIGAALARWSESVLQSASWNSGGKGVPEKRAMKRIFLRESSDVIPGSTRNPEPPEPTDSGVRRNDLYCGGSQHFQRCARSGAVEATPGMRPLAASQVILAAYLFAVLGILLHLHQRLAEGGSTLLPMNAVFSALAFVAGMLSGIHFGLAIQVMEFVKDHSERVGSSLYALDLIGAATGALLVSLYLLPVHGVATTLAALAILTLGSALALARFRRTQ